MNLINVGDKVRMFNEDELKSYKEAGGTNVRYLDDCFSSWDYVGVVIEIDSIGGLLIDNGFYTTDELVELL